jgi:hypothetical protein
LVLRGALRYVPYPRSGGYHWQSTTTNHHYTAPPGSRLPSPRARGRRDLLACPLPFLVAAPPPSIHPSLARRASRSILPSSHLRNRRHDRGFRFPPHPASLHSHSSHPPLPLFSSTQKKRGGGKSSAASRRFLPGRRAFYLREAAEEEARRDLCSRPDREVKGQG